MSLRSRSWFGVGLLVVSSLVSLAHHRTLAADPHAKPGTNPSDAAHQSALINRVIDHLRAGEERIKSLHVSWESRSQPRVDFWMEGKSRYRIDVSSGPESGALRQAFDGSTTLSYNAADRRGNIAAGDPGPAVAGVRLFPILLLVRPFSRYGLDTSPAKWRVVSEKAIIDNQHCVKLQTTHGRRRETIWIDPARDDLIVGWELHRRRMDTLVTIDYRRDETLGWIPQRWSETTPGRSRSNETTVIDYSMNQSIPNDLFAPPFPPETTVLDGRTLERYLVSKTGSKVTIANLDSPESQKIAKALEQAVDFTIEPQPFKDAIDFIGQRYQIKVAIDAVLPLSGIDSSMEVKANTAGIKLKDLMTHLLSQASKPLVYRVENGVLTILPAPRTK